MSFITEKIVSEGIDFDRVSILPAYSKIRYEDVDISARFSRRYTLLRPFVLEVNNFQNIQLVKFTARHGGVGVLGSNLDLKTRVDCIKALKRDKGKYSSYFFCVCEDTEMSHVTRLYEKMQGARTIVLDDDDKFKYFVDGLASLPSEYKNCKVVDLPSKYKIEGCVINANSKLEQFKTSIEKHKYALVIDPDTKEIVGSSSASVIEEYEKYPLSSRVEDQSLIIASKVAPSDNIAEEIRALNEVGVNAVIIEYEHPHSKWVLEELKHLKLDFPDLEVLVENVSTSAGATDILLTGVDGIVVGNKVKEANNKIGVGVPLPSAIYGVFKAVKHSDISLLLSGGLKNEGNVVKSLATGVDALWLNSVVDNADKCDEEFLLKEMEKLSTSIRKGVCYSGSDNLKSFKQNKFILNTGVSPLRI